MKRAALTLLATMVLAMMMALSTVVASAGWTWEDCPPASSTGANHRSTTASEVVADVEPSENEHAWQGNPGNKFK